MSSPPTRFFKYIYLAIIFSSIPFQNVAWAHGLVIELHKFFKYGPPAIIVGAFFGSAIGHKNAIFSSIIGAIVGMVVSSVVLLIFTGDIASFFTATILLFIFAIATGLIVGFLARFYRK